MTYEPPDYFYYGALKCFKPKKQIWQDIERYKPTIARTASQLQCTAKRCSGSLSWSHRPCDVL